jgi:tetratricopeptide (TPR) repeat protein
MAKPDLRSGLASIAKAMEDAAGLYRNRQFEAAEKICTRILKAQPTYVDALHLLGVLKLETGKPAAALTSLQAAAKTNPGSPQLLSNLCRALSVLGRDDEALAVVDKALALAPDSVEALNGRGNVLLKLNRAGEAITAFERAMTIEPRFLFGRASLGNALAQLGRYEEALTQYDAVLTAQPGHAETHLNRANALASLGRLTEALAAYARALDVRPDYLRAQLGRGVALQALNRHQEALAAFAAVLKADKDNADARHNEAMSLLTLGDYRRGFEAYEARWLRSGMGKRRGFGKPLWLGEYPLARKTILIHAEQGLGDTIQFVRYAPLLARSGAKVVIEAQPALATLLARVDGVSAVAARGEPLPAFDVHCPAGSLPLALRTELASIPAEVPYLAASPERIATWRERIARLPGPRIALVWSGSAAHPNDRNRSIALTRLAPLFEEQGSFISLQRDLRPGEAETLAKFPNITDVAAELDDFEDTAAVVSLCDLVIAVDTAVAHLAGAMGKPVWLLIPFQPDWRWLLDRDDSPWYPTARLFRQPAPGDWESVVATVKEELAKL